MGLLLSRQPKSQLISIARRLPFNDLVELGCPETMDELVSGLNRFGRGRLSDADQQLISELKGYSKLAKVRFLERIAEDIDPPLRQLLIRLVLLSFVNDISFNCSGHPPDGFGYLFFQLDTSSEVNRASAIRFLRDLREIEVPDYAGSETTSYFVTNAKTDSFVKWPNPEVELRLRRNTRTEKGKTVSYHGLGIEDVETLVRLWTMFGNLIGIFETTPVVTILSPDLFKPGAPGGDGYAGGRIFREVLIDTRLKEQELLVRFGVDSFFLQVASQYEHFVLRG